MSLIFPYSRWEVRHLSSSREHCAILQRNGEIYVTGGYNGQPMANVEKVISTDNSRIVSNLRKPRYCHIAGVDTSGRAWVLGGYSSSRTLMSSCEYLTYSTDSETWILVQLNLPQSTLFGGLHFTSSFGKYVVGKHSHA